ncbi:hypothetical protein BDV30DRAFT_242576 [Aspergillus minisclerotigenes]|uniref:Uncharacterized protein n=1 Tax=Aspergillus minisclerotigenes TaxID=656917 RepID=A0A5N6ISQ1_9EURO|nr:hypothetical protein BDV30DRAFT_242576 [Aspergillus minisclerotigenes]
MPIPTRTLFLLRNRLIPGWRLCSGRFMQSEVGSAGLCLSSLIEYLPIAPLVPSILDLFLKVSKSYIGLYIPLPRFPLSVWTGGNWQDTSRLPTGFEAHYDQVHAAARARGRKVLEFKVQDGWDPLCQFLGKEVPSEPFPHVNEVDVIARFHVIIFWARLVGLAKKGLIWASPVVAVGAAWWYFD